MVEFAVFDLSQERENSNNYRLFLLDEISCFTVYKLIKFIFQTLIVIIMITIMIFYDM